MTKNAGTVGYLADQIVLLNIMIESSILIHQNYLT